MLAHPSSLGRYPAYRAHRLLCSTANSISASTDIVSLCPKYFNIRRGQVIVATVGVFGTNYFLLVGFLLVMFRLTRTGFAPWKVLLAAGNFVSFADFGAPWSHC